MRLKLITSAIMLASTLAVVVAPAAADAKTRHRVTVCRNVREAANGGLVAGAIGGAGTLLVAALWIRWFPSLWKADRLAAPEDKRD